MYCHIPNSELKPIMTRRVLLTVACVLSFLLLFLVPPERSEVTPDLYTDDRGRICGRHQIHEYLFCASVCVCVRERFYISYSEDQNRHCTGREGAFI